jgi:hypothetical protein
MKAYKLEFSRFETMTDNKAKGLTKHKLQRKVRKQLKRKMEQEINDPYLEKRPTKKDR